MQHPEDYSPIVDHGQLEEPKGFLGRMTGKRDLPAAGMGTVLVLAGKDGSTIAVGSEITQGEKYWGGAVSWIKVDIGEHTLDLKVNLRDPSGTAVFVATITVGACVADAGLAASLGVRSVSDTIGPALEEAVASASGDVPDALDSDPAARLNKSLGAAEIALRRALRGEIKDLPDWLTAKVKSVSVAFDGDTSQHYSELVTHSREKQTIGAVEDNQDLQTQRSLKRDALVREALRPHLMNRAWRSFEAAIKDPSPSNIDRAVKEANDGEAAERALKVKVLTQLIGTDHLHEWSELREAMEQIDIALNEGAGRNATAAIESGGAEHTLEAEAHTDEHSTEPQDQ